MDPRDWNAAEWSAFGSVGALVVAVVVGTFIWVQVLQAMHQRRDAARPYVIVDFDFKSTYVYLTVKNIGASAAYDVTIGFDKPLEVPNAKRDPNSYAMFSSPIPMIAPGRVMKVPFGDAREIFKDDVNVALAYRAMVTYAARPDVKAKSINDPPLVLDLRPYKNTIIGADRVSEIARATKGINETLGRWSDNRDALRVRTINQNRARRKQARIDYWWSIRHIKRDRGWRGLAKWHVQQFRHRLDH
jgi:hypothetical protein